MAFVFPAYHAPDFSAPQLKNAPDAAWAPVERDGVAPEGFHSTSMYPEYFKIDGQWRLAERSRMDSSVVLRDDGTLAVVENRNLRRGDRVILGRTERGEEGIFLHAHGFDEGAAAGGDQFVFRQGRSRETSYARDYDRLIELLKAEREEGNILWVMGPAFAFDRDARYAMSRLIDNGYAHGLMAGNALATHDLEGALLHTALGQDIYTQQSMPNGHYNHLDVINLVRRSGSIPQFLEDYRIENGIMYSVVKKNVPFVLAGSIRDDGPLPEVIGSAYEAQSAMRALVEKAHDAAHDRDRQHDPLVPRTRGRERAPRVFLLRGRRRVRGQQAHRPRLALGYDDRDERAGFHLHRRQGPGADVKRLLSAAEKEKPDPGNPDRALFVCLQALSPRRAGAAASPTRKAP